MHSGRTSRWRPSGRGKVGLARIASASAGLAALDPGSETLQHGGGSRGGRGRGCRRRGRRCEHEEAMRFLA
ncbi:NAD_binding_11 domain-containing protein [Psidium guajava]|nr:NAD_binding_11 domain-containing protein [Psidium guajava]